MFRAQECKIEIAAASSFSVMKEGFLKNVMALELSLAPKDPMDIEIKETTTYMINHCHFLVCFLTPQSNL